jgi:hypothetical protein
MSQKKVIALLELTGTYKGGVNFEKSFSYFWTLYPNFVTFEIIDIQNDVNLCLTKLEEYYQKGYRIFFGPLSSTILSACISWFNSHNDAICITPVSNASSLSYLKPNVYRLQPSNYYSLNFIQSKNPGATRVFYVYNIEQLTCQDLLQELNAKYTTVIPYAIETNSSNLTEQNISNYYTTNNISSNDVVIILIINSSQWSTYISFFNTLTIPAVQYDLNSIGLPTVTMPNNLNNKYNCVFIENINSTSILEQSKTILQKSYAKNSLTSLYLLTLLANNESINNAYSYGEAIPWFNVNNDLEYWSYSIYLSTSSGFTKTNIYLNDPSYGILTFNKKV